MDIKEKIIKELQEKFEEKKYKNFIKENNLEEVFSHNNIKKICNRDELFLLHLLQKMLNEDEKKPIKKVRGKKNEKQ